MDRSWLRVRLWAVALAAAACNGTPTAPTLAACHSGVPPLVLSVGADSAMDPVATSGCIVVAANASGTDSAEYLLVPQASTTAPDFHSSFKLAGGAAITASIAAQFQAAPASPAEQFHDRLRRMEEEGAYPVPAGMTASARGAAPSIRVADPSDTVGNQRPFRVLSNLTNPTISTPVNATAKSVGAHIILYVDNAAPANGLSPADYDKLRSDFDTLLYAVDTTAFGRESDIDGNGRVIVLMSNVINRLVTAQECVSTGYVTGFFFAGDLAPSTRSMWNNGEIFYTIVADSGATLGSCPHTNSQVNLVVPVTFIHEFQHMISFNQHALVRGGGGEVLWLNEGLSHYAEELGGRVFLQAGDNPRFCDYVRGDLYNFGLYLANPGASGLVASAGVGTLSERGAWWAFVRYLVDQFAADTSIAAAAAFTRAIDRTTATGTDNVIQRTGVQFATLAKRWVLANWVSDLPGFTAPSTMKYKHWAFRSDYPALHASCTSWSTFQRSPPDAFPLAAPGGLAAAINVSGTIYAGSAGTYQRALQGPGGAQFTLLFSDGSGAQLQGSVLPRLNVLRIR